MVRRWRRSTGNNTRELTLAPGLAIRTPRTFRDLAALAKEGSESLVSKSPDGFVKVVRTGPGIVTKFPGDMAEEVIATRFARRNTSLAIPRIVDYPATKKVWYISMEEIPGVSLDRVIDEMSPEHLRYIAEQLKTVLAIIRRVKSPAAGGPRLGSVTGGRYRNELFPEHLHPNEAFASVGEFVDYYRDILLLACTESFTDGIISKFPRNAAICFCHGDLFPRNIMVNPESATITGIIDWAFAGFYPEFWEYARMHDPQFMTPGWKEVLETVFPGPKRQEEIDAYHKLIHAMHACLII